MIASQWNWIAGNKTWTKSASSLWSDHRTVVIHVNTEQFFHILYAKVRVFSPRLEATLARYNIAVALWTFIYRYGPYAHGTLQIRSAQPI